MKTFNFLVMTMAYSLTAQAQIVISNQRQATAPIRPATTATSTSAPAAAAPAPNGIVSSNFNSLEQSSKDTMANSQKGQTVTKILQAGFMATGAMYSARCGKPDPGACVQAAMMFMMGGQAGKSAASFNAPIDTSWKNACYFSSLGCSSSTPENPYTAALTPGVINEGKTNGDIAKIKVALSKNGYGVDDNFSKLTTPNGEFGSGDLKSAVGEETFNAIMEKAKEQERLALEKIAGVSKAGVTAALGFDGGGGGGMGVADSGGYENSDASTGGASVASRLAKLRNPAQAKGLTKNFNGDPIGVAADSIFEMMNRRYQLKTAQKTFFQ